MARVPGAHAEPRSLEVLEEVLVAFGSAPQLNSDGLQPRSDGWPPP